MHPAVDKPELIVRVTLRRSEDGGRRGPTGPIWFGCPLYVGGRYFDCRLLLEEPLAPGATAEVFLKLLWPEGALPFLPIGARFELLERGIIGEGEVLEHLTP